MQQDSEFLSSQNSKSFLESALQIGGQTFTISDFEMKATAAIRDQEFCELMKKWGIHMGRSEWKNICHSNYFGSSGNAKSLLPGQESWISGDVRVAVRMEFKPNNQLANQYNTSIKNGQIDMQKQLVQSAVKGDYAECIRLAHACLNREIRSSR